MNQMTSIAFMLNSMEENKFVIQNLTTKNPDL